MEVSQPLEVKIVTSAKGLKFLMQQFGDLVYIGLRHDISWLGQVHVYEAVDKLGLEFAEKFGDIRGVNSVVFYLGDHSISEVEEALKTYSEVA